MKLKLTALLTMILCWNYTYAQDKQSMDVTHVTKATFFNPGISYEMRIARFQTLYARLFMNTSGSVFFGGSLGSGYSFYFDPAVKIQYRYYYNGKRRMNKNKRVEMNSMNYLTPVFETVFSKKPFSRYGYIEKDRRAINSFGLAWGFQRNYQKRFSLDLYMGLGYYFTKVTTQIYPQTLTEKAGAISLISQLNLGFWLNKRK